jgi:serine phosphatase RsbU (regulator of sigma subunit)/anti-sigma regulatory factor (Ser/Thr protein kinase)
VAEEARLAGVRQHFVVNDDDSVAAARRYVAERALSAGREDLAEDLALVTSELVTNGLLYAGPPVEVSVAPVEAGLRVEVADRSRIAPMRAVAGPGSMTGRGLSLVEALSARWGAEQREDGKVVWAELTGESAAGEPTDFCLDLWDDEADEPATSAALYTIELGDVPTDLLLEAKAHVDNLVREFALAARQTGAEADASVPAELAHLVEAVVDGFAEARQAIRRQALEASARGDDRTRLVLSLPASAADAGEAYLAALEEADTYARAARLLTLETPPQHLAFRRWYVESLVTQLREVAAGRTPAPPPTLERRLLDEFGTLALAQRATARAARLHGVAAALAGARTPEEVAAVAVAEGVAVLGAVRAAMVLLRPDGSAWVPAAVGHSPESLTAIEQGVADTRLPVRVALSSGDPVWIESQQQRDESFPALRDLEPGAASLCAYPLRVAGDVVAALRYSFDIPRLFDEDERRFVGSLATQTAQALDRSMAQAAEEQARARAEATARRLSRLQTATAELASADDVTQIAEVIVTHAADALGAQDASVSILVDGTTLEIVGQSPGIERLGWSRYPADMSSPAGEAVRSNQPVIVRTGAELDARYPAVAGLTDSDRWLICLPLSIGTRRLGVISISFPVGREIDVSSELSFLTTLADTCAQALDRAHAQDQARAAANKLTFLADASAELASSLDYRTTLTNVARLVVPRLADWCTVSLVEDGDLQTVAVSHIDPDKVRVAAEMEAHYPSRLDQPGGVRDAIVEGRSQLYPVISDKMLEYGAADADHLALLRQLGMSSVLVVPLSGRSGRFGAISLVMAESDRHYTEDDRAFAEELAARVAIAVENAVAFRRQSGQLAAITRVAEAAQHAILAPVPERVGPLRMSAAYVSAARDALVGGDLYEVIERGDSVRLLIGDVRGKGLDAVRLATVVLGEFRSAAVELDSVAGIAQQMDRRLRAYLTEEDFVTALIAEVAADGTCSLVTCGHPPAYLTHGSDIRPLGASGSPPLGLGAAPDVTTAHLGHGDRLLLYTDGLIEARDADGRFVEVDRAIRTLPTAPLDVALEEILLTLRDQAGGDLGDDLAMLLAEFDPAPD